LFVFLRENRHTYPINMQGCVKPKLVFKLNNFLNMLRKPHKCRAKLIFLLLNRDANI